MARILVIDDEAAVLSVLGRMLRRAGHELMEAADGPTGIQLLRRQPADLAIVDIFLAGQGGLTTIQGMRTEWPALKILAISGADRTGSLQIAARATALGADDFLKKPFEATELLRVIGTLLSPSSTPTAEQGPAI
jgi:DNA-binding response OmpR family regulator